VLMVPTSIGEFPRVFEDLGAKSWVD
jgi:hypothetical protein